MNHFLSIRDLDAAAVPRLFRLAAELKGQGKARDGQARLRGRTLALIFEKPSLRTRVTFEVAMVHLGGRRRVPGGAGDRARAARSPRPTWPGTSRVWVDAVAARVFAHQTVEELARHASIPVINALSDEEHPCQALADFFTLWERGLDLARLRLAWIGDGNNVCHSVLRLASLVGTAVAVATPPGFEPDPRIVEECRRHGGRVTVTTEAREAVEGADVVYTDVWISMGQEEERERRLEAFQRYQLSPRLLAFASPRALVMHCLPAHRGEEIADEVLDGAQSVVLDQAENRLHAQKAVLLRLLGEDWAPAGGDGAGRERP